MDFEYTNDLVITNGDIRLVTGLPEDAQRIKDRLSTFIGEWFLDLQFGPDYRKDVLKKSPNIQLISALLRKEILKAVPGAKILDFTSTLNSSRRLSISYTVKTNNGVVVDVIAVPSTVPPVIVIPPPAPNYVFSDFVVPFSVIVPAVYQGFGAAATGGITPFTVTSLADGGPGTLRDALSVSGRYITFAVGGTISLVSAVFVLKDTTIDGFSAPTAITVTNLTGDGLRLLGNSAGPTTTGSNIIVKGIRVRDCAGDGIQIAYNAHDIIIDHTSSGGNADGDIDITNGSYNVTISWCLMKNKTGPSPGCSLLSYNAGLVSYHHNLFYGGNDRNPIITHTNLYSEAGPSGPPHGSPMADARYNIVCGYEIGTYIMNGGVGGNVNANVVSNLYQSNGLSSPGNTVVRSRFSGGPTRADAYIAGNVANFNCSGNTYMYGTEPDVTRVTCNDQSNIPEITSPVITGPTVTDKQGRLDVWTSVKNSAGVIGSFADDTYDALARSAVIIPAIGIFTQTWNDG